MSRRLLPGVFLLSTACASPGEQAPVERPADVPALHHVGLNSVDPHAAVAWYVAVWPAARATEIDDQPAVAAEMYLVIDPVDDPLRGALEPELGRSVEQSAFWHICSFVKTTGDRDRMAAREIDHRWLSSRRVTVTESPRSFDIERSLMIEGPDRPAIELVELRTDVP